jgi:pyrroline-5-carboxylate reductase
MLNQQKIGFIGGGNMGEALIKGLIGSGAAKPGNITCSDIHEERIHFLQKQYGINVYTNNIDVIRNSQIIIYAVKPQIMAMVLKESAGHLDGSKLVISVAAGISISAFDMLTDKQLRLIRVMPNVPALIGEGATAVTAGPHADKEDIQTAMQIFKAIGKCVYIKEEHLMDAVTGLSGSGPAYLFVIIEALSDAGVKMGLTRQDALLLAAQTVLGSAKLLLETGNHPGQLKDMVTSPAGTTIAGLHALEKSGIRAGLINAVEAATERSRALGDRMIESLKKNINS